MPDSDRAAGDGVDPEGLQRDTESDDVDDRVDRADLVELDIAGGHAMDLAFDLGERPVDGECAVAGTTREIGGADQFEHLAGRAVDRMRIVTTIDGGVGRVVDGDVRPGRADSAALDPLERDRVAIDAEPAECAGDLVDIGPGIDERRQQHVAGHAGAAVEPHGAAGHRRSIRTTAHAAP